MVFVCVEGQRIYPTVVIILVIQQRSFEEGVFTAGNLTGSASNEPAAIDFAPNPVGSSSTIVDNENPVDDAASNNYPRARDDR